ncbi:phosphatase PAP2 family protein [Krasilnikovia cinnamomea]|uniref:phosphatase PAP2 family protein n=1 Tax=Krasilnikovia cinnamomea TaxID=349313 RepID=UPI00102BE0CC|nr:phosphatase PAP2 family protein [Krasilnikovia cinnamomea]
MRHFAERSVFGLLALVAIGLGFGTLLLLVRFHWAPLQRLDHGVAEALNHLVAPHPVIVSALSEVSGIGGRPFMLRLVVLAVIVLLIRRRTRLAIYLVVAGAGALLLDPSVKTLVGRVRPIVDVPVAVAPGNSFPSGHALGSMVVYGALLLVFLPAVPRRARPYLAAATALTVFAIGVSRTALGVHYLSDVLAGWLLGAAWLGVTAYAFRVWRREAGVPVPPLEEGLEPESARQLRPAPDERQVLPHPWTGAAEIVTGWVLTFGLLYTVGYAVTHLTAGTWLASFDVGVPRWLQTFRTSGLDQLSYLWSKAGDTHAILAVCLVFCPLALALWRQWRLVLFVALSMLGELTLFLCTGAAVARPRPPVAQLDGPMPTTSFPSGHIAATMCLWSAIALLTVPRLRHWWRWVFVVLAVVMPAGVALSRMYRGEHHPTDALGALLLTVGWLSVLMWTVRPNADLAISPRRPPRGRDHRASPRTGDGPPGTADRTACPHPPGW